MLLHGWMDVEDSLSGTRLIQHNDIPTPPSSPPLLQVSKYSEQSLWFDGEGLIQVTRVFDERR